MQVLVFRHVPFEHLGLIADSLERHRIAYRYVDTFRPDFAPPDGSDSAGIISMGGPMSANDGLPALDAEIRLLAEFVRAGKPVLGVCLGSQLLARALGARVYRNPVKEIGWKQVNWSEAARADALLFGLNRPEVLFHWHGETFDLPAGAELLASTPECRNQAYRAGGRAWGFQFHLEVTPEMIVDWCGRPENAGDMAGLDAPIDPRAHSARLAELSRGVFDRWCRLLGASAGAA